MPASLLGWTLRAQNPLPHPCRRYRFRSDKQTIGLPIVNEGCQLKVLLETVVYAY